MAEMSEQAREARRIYMRAYRQKHKEAEAERKRRYWERKGAQLEAERGKLAGGGDNA